MDLKQNVRTVLNFPKNGVRFRDITPLMEDANLFHETIDAMIQKVKDLDFDKIAAADARGFFFAPAMAYTLKKGFIPIRKKGKLPYLTVKEKYALEYGFDTIEMNQDAVKQGDKILLLDDLLATGGTAVAMAHLIERQGGKVVACEFLIDLIELGGRTALNGYDVRSVMEFTENE